MLSRAGLPERIDAVLTYCDRKYLSVSTGIATSSVFRLNSLFDPDYSGVGHQPMYFDQFTPMYNQYMVTKCIVKVHLQMSNTAAPTPMGVSWLIDCPGTGTASAQEDPATTWERENGEYIPLDPAVTRTYQQTVDIAEVLGVRPDVYKNDLSSWSSVVANPTNCVFGRLCAIVADNTATQSMFYQIQLTYHCSFMTRSLVAPS